MKQILSGLGFIAGIFALIHQFMIFVLIHGNRSSDDTSDYTFDDIAQLLTLLILVIFMAICVKGAISDSTAKSGDSD